MKEIRLFYTPDIENVQELPVDEAIHAARVLRMKEGDEIKLTDGKGSFYDAVFTLVSQKHCYFDVLKQYPAEKLWKGSISLVVAPTKNMDRMEWLAEKATEIGCDRISFIDCKNSERRQIKTDRIERIVVAATKQSHKARKPFIGAITDFSQYLKQSFEGERFIAHCLLENEEEAQNDFEKYARRNLPYFYDVISPERHTEIFIGPEGDFTPEEVRAALSAGCQPVSLGGCRLRTETAALSAVQMMYMKKKI